MRENGIDPARTNYIRDVPSRMLGELFIGGMGDMLFADLPTAYKLEQEGKASITCLLADTFGPVPNSIYYTRRDRLDAVNDRLTRFLTAVQRAMNVVKDMKVSELTDIGAAVLPHIDRKVLQAIIAHVQSTRTWESAYLDRDSYERWIRFLHTVPLTRTLIPYEQLVDTRAMDGAMAALGTMKA
jgi:ABC-type nitrate/sulfonate/bicarbonate transport system substrate-binding protein